MSPSDFYTVERRTNSTELVIRTTVDTCIYSRINDTISCRKPNGKVVRKLILKANLISEFIDSVSRRRILYQYSNNFKQKEIGFYNLHNNQLSFERTYSSFDSFDLYDFHDITYGINYDLNFENRIVSEYFKLNQQFRRYKEIQLIDYPFTGGSQRNYKYQYSYVSNERDLVVKKIIKEINEGIFKDTVSYTYTCKY